MRNHTDKGQLYQHRVSEAGPGSCLFGWARDQKPQRTGGSRRTLLRANLRHHIGPWALICSWSPTLLPEIGT